MKKNQPHSTNKLFFILLSAIFILAIFLRFFRLGQIPAGLHQDEAWYAYNGFLLTESAQNIYGQKWPLTVDMWGDYVTSWHSWFMGISARLFGNNTFAYRLPTTTAAVLTMILICWWLYRLTKNKLTVVLFALLFATSQWSLVMSRASSSTTLESLAIILVLLAYFGVLNFMCKKDSRMWQKITLLAGIYGLLILAYLTYFSIRIVLPPMMLCLLVFVFYKEKKNWREWLLAFYPVIIYMLFPFLVFLNMPYARGRYEQTSLINNDLIATNMFNISTAAGKVPLPILITRTFFNKITLNTHFVIKQYLGFFSPNVLLFQTAPPIRYFVPNSGVSNYIEYLGFLLSFALIVNLFAERKNRDEKTLATTLLFLAFICICAIPTALTLDDYPNLQRGVLILPYWQIVAALSLSFFLNQIYLKFFSRVSRKKYLSWSLTIVSFGIAVSLIPFCLNYFYLSPYYEPYYRYSEAEVLGEYLNKLPATEKVVVDHRAGIFVYPYLQAQESILEKNIVKKGQYYFQNEHFQIDNRLFLREIASNGKATAEILAFDPEYLIVKVWDENKNAVISYTPPECFIEQDSLTYSNNRIAYKIYQKDINCKKRFLEKGFHD
ncbi:MAG: hypothetical protein Q4G02_03115 [bacterium]|nr:hypothetical protein [bacterium]